MLKEISKKLSGGQITLITMTMILAPVTVTAAVTFQPVAIVDPSTGKQSFVDNARRLWVFDPVAGYRNSPANLVRITVSNGGSQCETAYQYVVPAGKALILTAITGHSTVSSGSYNFAGYYVMDGANCTGALLTTHVASGTLTNGLTPVTVDLGAGIAVAAGKTVSVLSQNNGGLTFLHGYLVPSSVVPAMAMADGEKPPREVTAAEVGAKPRLH